MRTPLAALAVSLPSLMPAQNAEDYLDSLLLPAVRAKLQSENAGLASWGGALAGKYRLSQLGRELAQALAHWNTSEDPAARVVRLHLLDGMIRAEVDVPGDLLEVSLQDRLTRGAATVVLFRNLKANLQQIEALATDPALPGCYARAAAAQLLVVHGMRSPKLAKILLAHVEPTFSVTVGGEGSRMRRRTGGVPSQVRPVALTTEAGFPPLVRLRVSDVASVRVTTGLLVGRRVGSTQYYFSRQEGVEYEAWELERCVLVDHLSRRNSRRLISSIGRGAMEDVQLVLDGSDAAVLKREVEERYRALRGELDEIVSRLRKGRWLLEEDLPGFRIPIKFEIEDKRGEGDKSPLPEFELEAKR
ncbi:MAG: hypothetical protein AB8H80_00240 [Planctomycetota bacterium]